MISHSIQLFVINYPHLPVYLSACVFSSHCQLSLRLAPSLATVFHYSSSSFCLQPVPRLEDVTQARHDEENRSHFVGGGGIELKK